MWDRYADGYKGVCLGFDFKEDQLREVMYVKEPVSFELTKAFEYHFGYEIAKEKADYSDKKFDFLNEPFFRKDKEYEKEKEVRCLFSKSKIDDKFSNISIDGKEGFLGQTTGIKEIIITEKTDKQIIQKIKESFKNLQIKKVSRKDESYELEIVELNFEDL